MDGYISYDVLKSSVVNVMWFIPICLDVYVLIYIYFFFFARQSPLGQGLLIHEVSRSHITTQHSRQDSSGRVISSSHRPLPDNTQHSQQTNIHAPGGIRTHDLSRRAAADLLLRARSYWDRHIHIYSFIHLAVCLTTGPKPLPKRAVHIVRSRASSFK